MPLTAYATILFEVKEGIAFLTLNRPDAFNSVNREMAQLFQQHLKVCGEDSDIRSVYLTGSGKAFCAGQDLREASDKEKAFDFEEALRDRYNPMIRGIRNLPKPVVCAVNGIAAGAGANIALACDIVVAKESASFLQAFSKIGLIPDSGGTFILPRLVGFQKALAISMLADTISAKEAEKMGMIYAVFSEEDFIAQSHKLAGKLAKMPTQGLAYIKEAFNRSMSHDLEAQLKLEKELQTKAGATEDYQEGLAAFLEKRRPNFKGR